MERKMPDESFKSYKDVIDYLKSKKNRRINLLFGNGFSIAYDRNIFSYNALSNFVKESCSDPMTSKLFDIVGSTNFETVMRHLNSFVKLGGLFLPDLDVESIVSPARQKLKDNLIKAISELHPEYVFKISEQESKSCADFLKPFLDSKGVIFSTNYDLLLYWVLMRESDSFTRQILDGFSRKNEDEDLTWETGTQNIFYLHGSLMLFEEGNSIVKEEYTGDFILENIKKRIYNDQYPIFVTGGTKEEKLDTIFHNHYLSYCYDKLANLTGSLVVIGFGFGKYDTHIIDAINQAAKIRKGRNGFLCSIFIGYYSEEDREYLIDLCSQFDVPPEKIRIFNAKTANIWDNAPR